MTSVAIVGAGIGGLCTGIELLLSGYNVTLYEKNNVAGGVLKSFTSPDGVFRFEESASIPINPLTYYRFFTRLGLKAEDYFNAQVFNSLYNLYDNHGLILQVPHRLQTMENNLRLKFTPEEAKGYSTFIYKTMYKYTLAKKHFLNQPFMTCSSWLNPKCLLNLMKLNPFTSTSHYVGKYVKNEALRSFILFQSFFMGIAPKKLPNIYSSIAANTQIEGLIHIQGGLSHYAQVLVKLFEQKGGKIYYNTPVQHIFSKDHHTCGLLVESRKVEADLIVLNTDYLYSQQVLLHRQLYRPFTYSCSTFIIHLGLSKHYPSLNVHNLFINKHFEKEINNLFKGLLPQSPSLYIYSPSCKDKSYTSNPDYAVMNIMVRVPHLKACPNVWNKQTCKRLYNLCLNTLVSIPGLEDLTSHICYHSFTTPIDFKHSYNYHYGSCFGLGHTFLQSMVFRPQLKDKTYHNLYFVGTSIHPGNGASIVIEGAHLVARAIKQDYPL